MTDRHLIDVPSVVDLRHRITRSYQRILLALFGDRTGLAVFVGSLCLFWLYWRIGVFITDTYTVANAVHALANGHLDLRTAQYGTTIHTPGTAQVHGRVYARNYGVVVAALPLVGILRLASSVADLRILLVAIWALLLLSFTLHIGAIVGRDHLFAYAGSLLTLIAFLSNVAVATPLSDRYISLIALQLVHMIAAAGAAVAVYRLVCRLHDRRTGAAAATLLALGTPLGLWAGIPKRHVVIGAIALGIAYCLYRSRTPVNGPLIDRARHLRALAYALVGLAAWVHAPEALILLLVLVLVDLPTAPANDRWTLLTLAVTFALSLLPFLITNTLITGAPFVPPRMWSYSDINTAHLQSPHLESAATLLIPDQYRPHSKLHLRGASGGLLGLLDVVPQQVIAPLTRLFRRLANGAAQAITSPSILIRLYLRNGYAGEPAGLEHIDWVQATNLSILESAPVLAGVAAVGSSTMRSAYSLLFGSSNPTIRTVIRSLRERPERAVDAYAVLLIAAITFFYLPWFPLPTQITVRYLFPVYLLLTYAMVRCPPVRAVLTTQWRLIVWSVAFFFLVGIQLVITILALSAPGLGEAFQFHALIARSLALLLGIWALTGRSDGWYGRLGAVVIALTTAAGAIFVAMVTVEYYPLANRHALPLVRALADVLTLV